VPLHRGGVAARNLTPARGEEVRVRRGVGDASGGTLEEGLFGAKIEVVFVREGCVKLCRGTPLGEVAKLLEAALRLLDYTRG
jgi:hypothetical protein